MNEIIKNDKSSKIKLITSPKIKVNVFNNSKSKAELRAKINCNIKDEEEKNICINIDHNDNLTPLDNKNIQDMNCVFNYESKLNNNPPNEKSTKTNDSSGEEKIKRKIQVQAPLNLNDKFNGGLKRNNNIAINILNKYNLSLSLMNYISNKPYTNNIISRLSKENINNKNDKNLIIKKAIYYKDYNIKKEKQNNMKGKSLTESNININFKNKLMDNSNNDNNLLYTQNIRSNHNTESNYNKFFIKNKSYECLKTVTKKNIDKNNDEKDENKDNDKYINNNANNPMNNNIKNDSDNNKGISKENNNGVCHYIKVNKIKIKKNNVDNTEIKKNNNRKEEKEKESELPMLNINKEIEAKNKNDKINKKIINYQRNHLCLDIKNKNKTYNNNEFLNVVKTKTKNKITEFKKIENDNNNYINNLPINKTEKIKRKNIKIFDKNKLEHNIFLDKTYQNRFKKKNKNQNIIQNDIFTSDKQKEYNTFIVKKKSNYISEQMLNSNNSNSSNQSNKDWVYRLYNKEIKKQKIKNKIILLLRKSILNEKKEEKKLTKSKTVKNFNNYNYPINEGYNIDDNFNIINLFLSDDKKMKKNNKGKKRKKIKKCQSFHSYRNKQKKYSFDSNFIEDEKIGKLIEDKMSLKNYRSYKKFRLLYNEELINEEDEEKEQEKDEDEQ